MKDSPGSITIVDAESGLALRPSEPLQGLSGRHRAGRNGCRSGRPGSTKSTRSTSSARGTRCALDRLPTPRLEGRRLERRIRQHPRSDCASSCRDRRGAGSSGHPRQRPAACLHAALAGPTAARSSPQPEGKRRAVVIGASFIGLEVAGSLRAAQTSRSTSSLPSPHPSNVSSAPSSAPTSARFTKSTAWCSTCRRNRARIEPERVVLDNGTSLRADLVVIGVGVRPRTDLAAAGGTCDRSRDDRQ